MNDWFEAEHRVERAQRLSESQRWEEALAEIDVALSINPHNALWHAHRGSLLEELSRWDDAADAYQAALELEPGDSEVGLSLGMALGRLGRHAQAIEVLESLARDHPDLEPTYCHRIGIYAELGQHDKAEEMFYLAQNLDESCPYCFYHMGGSLAARGQHDRAIFCWLRVLELDVESVGVNRRIAQSYRAQGKASQAREYYLHEVRDDPGNTDLLYELGELAFESGELAAAAAKFGQVLELDGEYVEARFMLGRIWLQHGQASQALACFEAVRATNEEDLDLPGLELCTGEALFRLARFTEAAGELELALDKEPRNRSALNLLGDSLLALNKPDAAADAYRRLLALDADHASAHHKLAVCLLRLRQDAAALNHALQAVRGKSDFGTAMQTAILAHLRLAQWPQARSMARRAMKNDPKDVDLRRFYRRIWRYRLRYYVRSFLVRLTRALKHPVT